jgi:hypothetical protein
MQPICPLQNSTTEGKPGALPAVEDYSPQAFPQGDEDTVQTDGSKLNGHARAPTRHRPVRFGLPCARCKAYYASDLPACPMCKCAERVSAEKVETESTNISKKPSADVLRGALRPPIQLASHRDEDGNRFHRWESRLLLCADTEEINAGVTSLCILDENHNAQSEYASICLSCYEQLREKLARAEAALFIDLGEAAQIVYRAVWSDPSPSEPSRAYQSAARALLNELCHRAGIASSCGVTPSGSA